MCILDCEIFKSFKSENTANKNAQIGHMQMPLLIKLEELYFQMYKMTANCEMIYNYFYHQYLFGSKYNQKHKEFTILVILPSSSSTLGRIPVSSSKSGNSSLESTLAAIIWEQNEYHINMSP